MELNGARIFFRVGVLLGIGTVHAVFAAPVGAPVQPMDDAKKMAQAYKSVTQHHCAEAIPQLDRIYWTSPAYFNDALFYIIYCQDKLGNLAAAKNNIKYLKQMTLTSKQRKVIQDIQEKTYSGSISVISLSTYAGAVQYLNTQAVQAASFWGLSGSWNDLFTRVGLGVERLWITSPAGYVLNQTQFSTFIGHSLGKHWSTKFSGFYLNNDDVTSNQGMIGGVWLAYIFTGGSSIGTEGFFSYYPGAALTVMQGSLVFSFPIFKELYSSMYLDVKGMSIAPNSSAPSLVTLANQLYASGDTTLRLYMNSHVLTLGGWIGRRLFAVQNDGSTIMNIGLVRQAGARLSYSYFPNLTWQLSAFSVFESFLDGTRSSATLSLGGAVSLFL